MSTTTTSTTTRQAWIAKLRYVPTNLVAGMILDSFVGQRKADEANLSAAIGAVRELGLDLGFGYNQDEG